MSAALISLLPVDTGVVAFPSKEDGGEQDRPGREIEDGWMGLDIGPATIDLFTGKVADARTIVWNGPIGVFEIVAFAAGTLEVAQGDPAPGRSRSIGGGDSAAAVRILGLGGRLLPHLHRRRRVPRVP